MAAIDKIVAYGTTPFKRHVVNEVLKASPSLKKYHKNMYLCDADLWDSDEWIKDPNHGIYLFRNLSVGQYRNIINTLKQIGGCCRLITIIKRHLQ